MLCVCVCVCVCIYEYTYAYDSHMTYMMSHYLCSIFESASLIQ